MRIMLKKKILMETIETYSEWWLIFIFSIAPSTPLIVGLIKNPDDKSHSSLTWFLYLVLDIITMFSGSKVRINTDPMIFGFAIGSLIMTLILLYQKRYARFKIAETITLILIIICIIVWKSVGPYYTFITSILSEAIVGIYLIIQTFKYPKIEYNLTGYMGFFLISIISIIYTKDWSIQEVGFAISEAILSFVILIPLIKKWYQNEIFSLL